MSVTLSTTPAARVFDVEDLVKLALDGDLRIPSFQRPLRWGLEDARRLFDSVLRGYPLGSLLLWERAAPEETVRLGALTIHAPVRDRALWVVDGQQRLTTLANALSAEGARDERFALSVDLTNSEVVGTKPNDPPTTVPLPVLFDLPKLLGWFRDHPDAVDHLEAASGIAKKIREAKIPASVVSTDDEDVLRDIFDRLNNYGKRLTRAEVFSALNPAVGTGTAGTDSIEAIAAALDEDYGFGAIDPDTVLRAVLARRGADVTREIRFEFDDARRPSEFPGEDADTAHREAGAALARAVEFLQREADVPHFAFLPYRYLLIVLSRVFAHHEVASVRDRTLLRRWFWRAASAGPAAFPGSTTGAARTLCSKVDPGDLDVTLQQLLAAIPARSGYPPVDGFRSNAAAGKIIACVMWNLRPRSLRDGATITHGELAENLGGAQTPGPVMPAVVSRRLLPADVPDSAARRLLIPGLEAAPAEVLELLADNPTVTDDAWSTVLDSHAITFDAREHLPSDLSGFIQVRAAVLAAHIEQFLEIRWQSDFENTPDLTALIVDDLDVDAESVPADTITVSSR